MGLFPSEHETIEGVGRALRAGETTCVEVLEKCFDRIEEWEPRVKAWVRVDRVGATEQARALDAELAESKDRGPLHGIPIGIKDIIDVQGLPTACGFRPWADRVAHRDAPLVASLRTAGAVILGKTVTTQFAWIDPPPTRNPWNLERTPGGSSSGSAAAVALGMCLGSIGSQTGGSITRPASYCGVAGLKPTFRTLSVEGIQPFAPRLDHPGPIARTVGDLELIFKALLKGIQSIVHDGSSRGVDPTRPPTLGRLRGFFDEQAEPVMRQSFEEAIAALSGAGASVKKISLPDELDDIHRRHRVLMASEAAATHQARLAENPDEYQPRIRALIEEGMAISAPEYIHCHEHHDRVHGFNWNFKGVQAFLVPATTGPAPDRSTTGDPVFNSPWSYTGLPTISFPFALSHDGLPLALQLVGAPLAEGALFSVARWCEDTLQKAFRAKKD
jgi:aspartyl-tRNA(Asn)/glutamyl-tRNA(Gln) amidotransferase subunit A